MTYKVLKVDNFDPDAAADETISFAVGDTAYVIDLTADNAKLLREALQPYVEAAEKVGKIRIPVRTADKRTVTPRAKSAEPTSSTAPVRRPLWYRQQQDDSHGIREIKREYRKRVISWAEREHHARPDGRGRLADEWFAFYAETDEGARDAHETRAKLVE